MKTFLLLYRAEIRRLLTPLNMALPFFFFVLTGLIALISSRGAPIISYPDFLQQAGNGFLLTFGPVIIGGGMLALDVKEHWTRTLLLRPVTREMYLAARIIAVFSGFVFCYAVAGFLPVPIISLITGKSIVGSATATVGIFLLLSMHGLLLVVLLAFFSAWLSGIANIILLAAWAVVSQMAGGYIAMRFWDNALLTVLREYFFPSGFLDAAVAVQTGTSGILSGVFWGCCAVAGFAALAVWSFNRMNVEAGSE